MLEQYRQIIETPKPVAIMRQEFPHVFEPPMIQHMLHLSLEKIYCIAWMNCHKRDTISLQDVVRLKQLRHLQKTPGCRAINDFIYRQPGKIKRQRFITLKQLIEDVPDHYRIDFENIIHRANHKKHFMQKARNMHEKRMIDDFKGERSMMFELSYLFALKCEPEMFKAFGVMHTHNYNPTVPPIADDKLRLGWVFYNEEGGINITEYQSNCESVTNGLGKIIQAPLWSAFMLQQFIQYHVLRGVTRFTITHVSKFQKEVMESNYRDVPRAFGFERQGNVWVLDFTS